MMNKIPYLLWLLVLTACNPPKPESKTEAITSPAPSSSKDIALNGLDFKQADEMVRRFIKTNQSSAPVTSFWFNEDFLDALNIVLSNEGADGVRIYLAKDKYNKNTIVMVSTRADSLNGNPIHREYFSRTTTLLDAPYATAVASYNQLQGADLYTLTSYPQSCTNVSSHYLSPEIAASWVQKFRDDQPAGSPLPINTSSVWYHYSIFQELKSYLQHANNNEKTGDGFRIYVMRKNDPLETVSFVMVPTVADETDQTIHRDYYDCLEESKIVRAPSDNGHECPSFCEEGMTWGLPDSTKTVSVKPVRK